MTEEKWDYCESLEFFLEKGGDPNLSLFMRVEDD